MILSLVCAASFVRAPAQGPMALLDPKTYVSPSGSYRLWVNPLHERGAGKGQYILKLDGKAIWSKSFRLTLWDAILLDSGTVFGYAYSHGYEGFGTNPEDRSHGALDAVHIDAKGGFKVLWTSKREFSRVLHAPPVPTVRELLAFPKKGTGHLRLYSAGENEGEWLNFDLPKLSFSGGSASYGSHRDPPVKPSTLPPPAPKSPVCPPISLKLIGTTELKVPTGQNLVIGGKMEAAGLNRLAYLDFSSPKSIRLITVNYKGKRLAELSLPFATDTERVETCGPAWIDSDRFLVTRSEYKEGGKAKAWIVDVKTNRLAQIKGFDCPAVETIDAFADGTFAVIANDRGKYSSEDTVQVFSPTGKRLWTNETAKGFKSLEGSTQILSPEDVACTKDGKVAVIDVIRHAVYLFAKDGQFQRTVDLNKTWKREPEYPAEIRPDANGGFVVIDSTCTIVRMDKNGKILSSWAPRHANGQEFNVWQVAVGSDGRYWTTDGYALIGLNKKGIAEAELGGKPSPSQLRDVADALIDPLGRAVLIDRRTNAVHVFDKLGKRLFVGTPKVGEMGTFSFGGNLRTSPFGDIYVWGADKGNDVGFLHFSPSGKRVGIELPKPAPASVGIAQGFRWSHGALLDRQGRVIKEITRNGDGTWHRSWEAEWSDAPSGTRGLASDPGLRRPMLNAKLSTFSRSGEPLSCIDLHPNFPRIHKFAFDGKRFYLLTNKGVHCVKADGTGEWLFDPKLGKDEPKYVFLTDGGKALTLFASPNRLLKFVLPG